MTAPRGWRLAALLVLSVVAEPAGAQSRGVIVIGRVLLPDGAPALLAAVTVTALDDQSAAVELTNGEGRFRVHMEHRAATYAVSVRLRGFAPLSRPITVATSDSIAIVPELRLVRAAQDLPTVKVVSRRPPPVRDQGRYGLYLNKPGESQTSTDPSSGFGSALTGDLSGDMSLALGAVPGLTMTPGADGSLSFSLAGLGSDQNRLMVNGADVVVSPPRERAVLRVSTTGYDPTVAMSGVRAEWVIVGANFLVERRARLTMDVRPLQVATPVSRALGQRARAPAILSGVLAGPLWPRSHTFAPRFFSTQFDVQRRASEVSTLASIDAATLGALGVGSESVRRVLAAREPLGLPTFTRVAVDQRSTTAKLSTRVDFTRGGLGYISSGATGSAFAQESQDQARVFYLLFGGSTTHDAGSFVGPLTLPSFGTERRTTGLTAQAFHSVFPKEFIVNETRLSISSERSHGGPASATPSATVNAGLVDPDQSTGAATVQAAGSGGRSVESRYAVAQLYNETQWTSVGRRHQWKLGLDALLDAASGSSSASAGRFEFTSAEQFAANRPALFSRSLSHVSGDVHGVHLAAGLGDQYQPSKAWSWQYGVRLEGHGVRSGTSNPVVDSLFGTRTGVVPMKPSIAPMVGFTWFYGAPWGKNAMGFPTSAYSLVGGIRDYRGALSTRSAQRALAQTGLSGAERELLCVGDAAPAPDWRAYAASSASIPDRCADGSVASPLAQVELPVSAYATDYVQGHSWRADLAWNTRLTRRLFSSLRGRVGLNTGQPAPFDLNFAGVQRFALASEAGRPVFVSPASFDPASGRSTATESRRIGAYGSVDELRADLRSTDASLTAVLDFKPTITRLSSERALPFTLAYTVSSARAQSHGFIGSTAGDPRRVEWAPGAGSRHSIYLASALHVPDWARLTAGLRLWSGQRYTPIVLGDINGDGRSRNDRAFVFDPRIATDAGVATGMTALFESAPRGAARCLRAQLGAVAHANSCTGPWSATLTSSLELDPARVGLRNRGRVRFQFVNLLAAVDQLVHGARVHGWGQSAFVDPVLLRVSGFDPPTRGVRYEVNPSFGDSRVIRNLVQTPFRVSVDVSLDVGPNREREELLRRVAPDSSAPRIRLDSAQLERRINVRPYRLLELILREASTFELTEQQRDTLQALSVRYEFAKDSIYGALAGYLAARNGDIGDREAQHRWHDAVTAVAWKQWETGAAVRAIFSDAQWDRLFDGMSLFSSLPFVMDRRELARMLAMWSTHPY